MFTVNPERRVKFNHVHDDGKEKIEFSVTFDFVIAEDVDYGELRDKLKDKQPIDIIDPETNEPLVDPKTKEPIATAGMMNAYLYTLRTSLVEWTGIKNPDGEDLAFKDTDGNLIVAHQKAVFEAIRMIPDLFEKIQSAYLGHKGKN